jgi:hypothetical protein
MNKREADYYLKHYAKYQWAMRSVWHNIALTVCRIVAFPIALIAIPAWHLCTVLWDAIAAWIEAIKEDYKAICHTEVFKMAKRNKDIDGLLMQAHEVINNETVEGIRKWNSH